MYRPKVMTVVGTRPEIIKLSRVLAELDRHVDHYFVHTGQNYDPRLSDVFFSDLELRQPDCYLGAAAETPMQTIAQVLVRVDELLVAQRPDAMLVYGDTNSCLAAYPAKRRRVPVFHMEAGNRCFDERVPEEINRRLLDHLCDINLPLTEHARRYLIAEGLPPQMVITTGSPMREVLDYHRDAIARSTILAEQGLTHGCYFLVSCHREENVDDPEALQQIVTVLDRLAAEYGWPVLVSVHPRTRKRLTDLGDRAGVRHPLVRLLEPFGFLDYVHLQQHAACVLSDSGTITEESALLGFPAVTLRETHERPEGMDVGVLIMTGRQPERVLHAVEVTMTCHSDQTMARPEVADYRNPGVSQQVLKIILSYIEYVRRERWHESPARPGTHGRAA